MRSEKIASDSKNRSYMQTFIRHYQLRGENGRPHSTRMAGRSKYLLAIQCGERRKTLK